MMLTWLADACRDTGYPVVEVSGWQSRGHGGMTAAHGVVGHWTAGPADSATSSNTPSLSVVRDGRPGLDGPLCNVYTAFDGTLYVVAAGKAYHAGVSAWHGEDDLNETFVGNEVESPGGFAYSPAQLDVTPRLHASLLRRMGHDSSWSCAHFECAQPKGRKPDGPARDMAGFRRQVAGYLANPSTIRKSQQEDPDMPLDDSDGQKIKTWVNDCIENKFGLASGQNFSLAVFGATSNKDAINRMVATNNPVSNASMLVALTKSVADLTTLVAGMKADLSDDETKIVADAKAHAADVLAAIDKLAPPAPPAGA